MRNINNSLFGIGILYGFPLIKPVRSSKIPVSSNENFKNIFSSRKIVCKTFYILLTRRFAAPYWIIGYLQMLSVSVCSNIKFSRLPDALVVVLLQTVKLLSQMLLQNRRCNPEFISGGCALAFKHTECTKHSFRQETDCPRWMQDCCFGRGS